MCAGQAGIKRGEGPFRDHDRFLGVAIGFRKRIDHCPAGGRHVRIDDAVIEIDRDIAVPSHDVRILSGFFQNDGMVSDDAREAAAEQQMVGIDLAEGVMDGLEIEFSRLLEKSAFEGILGGGCGRK